MKAYVRDGNGVRNLGEVISIRLVLAVVAKVRPAEDHVENDNPCHCGLCSSLCNSSVGGEAHVGVLEEGAFGLAECFEGFWIDVVRHVWGPDIGAASVVKVTEPFNCVFGNSKSCPR